MERQGTKKPQKPQPRAGQTLQMQRPGLTVCGACGRLQVATGDSMIDLPDCYRPVEEPPPEGWILALSSRCRIPAALALRIRPPPGSLANAATPRSISSGSRTSSGFTAIPSDGATENRTASCAMPVGVEASPAAGGFSAWLVYRYLGLKFVSRSWFNLDARSSMIRMMPRATSAGLSRYFFGLDMGHRDRTAWLGW